MPSGLTTTTGNALIFEDAAAWRAWLAEHHGTAREVWLLIATKNGGARTVTIAEALDEALCHGWIDSHRRAFDGDHYLQRYSPRTRRSPWSAINAAKAEALTAAGRMRPAGRAAIEAAKGDGRWPTPCGPSVHRESGRHAP
ncbi:YdeI/OmpD-associated family protein [Actinomadura gamaensis]|uniref:YdeI family protein n=1 Tax=Actinomadura gamaensis TaxID=1763541 RepID=A0ABV9U0Y0_9ACTN